MCKTKDAKLTLDRKVKVTFFSLHAFRLGSIFDKSNIAKIAMPIEALSPKYERNIGMGYVPIITG